MPGMDGTGALFDPVINALPTKSATTVLRYPTDRVLGYEALTDWAWPQLPVNEPFVIVAESFSGPLAVLLAAKRPKGLRAMVLCASFIKAPQPWAGAWMNPLIQPLLFRVTPSRIRSLFLLGASANPSLRRAVHEALETPSPIVLSHRAREIMRVDVSAELSTLEMPVLYIQANEDYLVSGKSLHCIQQAYPDVQVVVIGGPHLLLQASSKEAITAILGFADGLERLSGS